MLDRIMEYILAEGTFRPIFYGVAFIAFVSLLGGYSLYRLFRRIGA